MINFAQLDLEQKGSYIKLLNTFAQLSKLFSDNTIPFLHYRVTENIFCQSFNASNLSRSDTAFDANYNNIGIGLKTFIINRNQSREKIAEFNKVSKNLITNDDRDLVKNLSVYRNERIDLGKRLYDIHNSIYHIIGRTKNKLILFETDYDYINISNIQNIQRTKTSISFEDGINQYSYNFSKSTLFRNFVVPENAFEISIEIIEDPYSLILDLFENKEYTKPNENLIKGINYIILPLYGRKRQVHQRSGLNQWHANGRQRNLNEVYIPIPSQIHKSYPDFFPGRDVPFKLLTPTSQTLTSKVCQDNSKALMTNPNKDLADWLLRRTLKLKEGELATIEKLDILGFDSVIIKKNSDSEYEIDIMKTGSYEEFINDSK